MGRHHWGGIIGEASSGRHHQDHHHHHLHHHHWRHLGIIWMHLEPPLEASGNHLDASGTIWVTSGRHLGGIREASGRHPSRAANKNYFFKMKVRIPPAPLIITILRILFPHAPSQSCPHTNTLIMTLHFVNVKNWPTFS